MSDFYTVDRICRDYELSLKGVVHLGARAALEGKNYHACGATPVVFVEALPSNFQKAVANTIPYNQHVYNYAINNVDDEIVDFHEYNIDAASSLFDMYKIKDWHPELVITHTHKIPSITLDTLISRYRFNYKDFNFLEMDVQGAELLALEGSHKFLTESNVNHIFTEVIWGDFYKDAPNFKDITEFLKKYNFYEDKVVKHGHKPVADVMYVRK